MANITLSGADVGSPALQGSTKEVPGGYDLTAGGADIWESSDQFHFAYLLQDGDFDLKARMESLEMPDLYTKAGLMARESLDGDSAHIFLLVFPDNSPRNKNNGGYEFQYRETAGGNCIAVYPPDATTVPPHFPVQFPNTWLRLKRQGDEFEAYQSMNGTDWKLYTRYTLPLAKSLYVGLAVTSHNTNQLVHAAFRDAALSD